MKFFKKMFGNCFICALAGMIAVLCGCDNPSSSENLPDNTSVAPRSTQNDLKANSSVDLVAKPSMTQKSDQEHEKLKKLEEMGRAVDGESWEKCLMGFRFETGSNGFESNIAKAVTWYRLAAEQGDAVAQCRLGMFYEEGRVVAQDSHEALKWYQKSAMRGNETAQYRLATMYWHGRGVAQNFTEARRWFLMAAENGHVEAQCRLACMYLKGEGGSKDLVEARRRFLLAAENGDVLAQCFIGDMYRYGKGGSQDYVEAVKWFRKSATVGFPPAQFGLAELHFKGRGGLFTDPLGAEEWLLKAADQGDDRAKNYLALMKKADQGDDESKKILSRDWFPPKY